MKAVLLLDEMPQACGYCIERAYKDDDSLVCQAEEKSVSDNFRESDRPDWCPLRPDYLYYLDVYDVEKHNQEIEDWLDNGSCSSIGEVFTEIWNAAINAITGEDQ